MADYDGARERAALDQEARSLVAELHQVTTTLKAGSAEREQHEDRIYQRLYELAELIQTRHATDPALQELRFAITQRGAAAEARSVKRLPVYTDEYKMFTQSPTNPKVQMFLEKMATDLQALPRDETQRLLADQTIDGPKDVLRTFVSKCQRERWLKDSAKITCKNCWDEVMRSVFMMTIEMVTVELKQRSHQIRIMTERGYLTEVDAMDLVKHVEKIIREVEHLLRKSERRKLSKTEWIALIEALFRLLVGLVNELMMRYVQFINFRRDNHNLG